MDKLIIAIDGPSGAGKSTVTSMLSKKLNISLLNTGALYRAVGLYCLNNNIEVENENEIKNHLNKINISVEYMNGNQITLLNGKDVSDLLYTPEIADICSKSSQLPCVRELILNIQRSSAKKHSLIIEGRDIGSVVVPNANFKFYIDASAEVRANRRVHDEKNKNMVLDYNKVLEDIKERDRRDTQRKISPLIRVKDAIYINTDNMTIDEVVNFMLNKIRG